MPTPPKPGESQANFLQRCIPDVIKDKTAEDQKQASAICYSMFKKSKDKSKARASIIGDGFCYALNDGLQPVKKPYTPPSAAHQPMRYPPNE